MAPTIAGTEDILVPSSKGDHDIPVRLFRPLVAADASKRNSSSGSLSKLLVWIHGGGWTIGSIASDDKIARRLASVSTYRATHIMGSGNVGGAPPATKDLSSPGPLPDICVLLTF
jgi:acetyl esterase/lipase